MFRSFYGERMITYLDSSVFQSPAQTLVNTVNVVGVMGKGVAKEFKARYPDMFSEYRELCRSGALTVGKLHIWRSDSRWVLNFPTKTTWKLPSRIEYIEAGLAKFVSSYKDLGITSASFPPLGCGNGNLKWPDVRPIMERYLDEVSIPVYIHDVQVTADFIPEHKNRAHVPKDFLDFSKDIREMSKEKIFSTSRDFTFSARVLLDNSILIEHQSGKRERIDSELLESSLGKVARPNPFYRQFLRRKVATAQELPFSRPKRIAICAIRRV